MTIEDAIAGLKPVEIVGNHFIHRERSDEHAEFYLREEVDVLIEAMMEKIRNMADTGR